MPTDPETRELQNQRRRAKQRRSDRVRTGNKSFFATPQSAIFCMLVALASVLVFWRGLPTWALLAIGFGAVVVVALAAAMWRAGRKR